MLPHDYTRCMGLIYGATPECPVRLRCARHRDLPQNTVLSWARNLNADGTADCASFIPYPERRAA